ncbi:MAG: hypothetical protein AAFR58_09410 [Cyanobacteria bacterium J06627_28]
MSGSIQAVAPPSVLLDLAELMADIQPQVAIASPRPNQVINDTQLELTLRLKGLSIYKDEQYGLGPHLQVFIDDQPAKSIYALDEPITLEGLMPGSHTLRVLAVRPWGESFKNEAAYAQTTFHVFAQNDANTPDPSLPLLTYSEPQGTYGAGPVLLDFYLNNAPLHQLAQANPQDDIADWQIRCTVNGKSFEFDQWQPTYLRGLTPGRNWVQLTLIDEHGQAIDNIFNSAVRTFIYDPDQKSSLAQLLRGELSLPQVGQIAVPGYEPPPEVSNPPMPEAVENKLTEDELTEDELTEDELTEDELTEDELTEDELTEDAPEPADFSEAKEDLREGAKPGDASADATFEVEDFSDSVDVIERPAIEETTDFPSSAASSAPEPAAAAPSDEVRASDLDDSDLDDSKPSQKEVAPSAIEEGPSSQIEVDETDLLETDSLETDLLETDSPGTDSPRTDSPKTVLDEADVTEQEQIIERLDDVTDELLPPNMNDAASELAGPKVNGSSSPATPELDMSDSEPLGAFAQLKKQLKKQLSGYWQTLQPEKAESRSPELPSVLEESPAALENTPADIEYSLPRAEDAEEAEELGIEPQINFPDFEKGADLPREEDAIAPLAPSETISIPASKPQNMPELLAAPSGITETVIVSKRPSDETSDVASDLD